MGSQNLTKSIVALLLYLAAQALFGQTLALGSVAFCFFYLGFLLGLPFEIGRVPFMGLAFGVGLAADILYNSIGLHAASCVLLAYLREPVKNWIRPGGGYEPGMEPTLDAMGFQWVFAYSGILIFVHHALFFVLEASNWGIWQLTLLKTLCSTLYTLVLVLIIKSLGIRRRRR
jgi:hypothetical protein